MTNTTAPDTEAVDPTPDAFEQPAFTGGLRLLIANRAEAKIRRIHKQWFCFDLAIVSQLRDVELELAQIIGEEVVAHQQANKPIGKYAGTPRSIALAQRRDDLKAQSLLTGAMAVFQNLTDTQLTEVRAEAREAGGTELDLGNATLVKAFLRWEAADGTPIPADVLGAEDLALLFQPGVLEEGEWKPLTNLILTESRSVVDRPTSTPQ